jgi:hypothetical protein
VALDDLQEALRCFTRALTAAAAFLDSRQAGMLALLDRQAKEGLKRVQVRHSKLSQLALEQHCDLTEKKQAEWRP